jgi:hypothetical protein
MVDYAQFVSTCERGNAALSNTHADYNSAGLHIINDRT